MEYQTSSSQLTNSIGGQTQSNTERLAQNIHSKIDSLEHILKPVLKHLPPTTGLLKDEQSPSLLVSLLETIDGRLAHLLATIHI